MGESAVRREHLVTWWYAADLRGSRECRLCPVGWASENSRPTPPLPPLQACCFLLSDDKFCKELGIFVVVDATALAAATAVLQFFVKHVCTVVVRAASRSAHQWSRGLPGRNVSWPHSGLDSAQLVQCVFLILETKRKR